jgi:hypothetical protein
MDIALLKIEDENLAPPHRYGIKKSSADRQNRFLRLISPGRNCL